MPEKTDHDLIVEMHTVLLGANGSDGLVKEVSKLCERHNKLSTRFYMLVGILVGSGILTASIYTTILR